MDIQIPPQTLADIYLKMVKVDEEVSNNPWAVPDVSEFLK